MAAGIHLRQELEAAGKGCTCRMHFVFLVLFGLEWRNPSFAQHVGEERAHNLFLAFSPLKIIFYLADCQNHRPTEMPEY